MAGQKDNLRNELMKNTTNLIFVHQLEKQSALLNNTYVGYAELIKIKIKEDFNKPINGMFASCS